MEFSIPDAWSRALPLLAWAGLALASQNATADVTAYRCESDGKVTYSSSPCVGTTQKTITLDTSPPSPADQAAAARRAEANQAEADRLENLRLKHQKQETEEQAKLKTQKTHASANCYGLLRRIRRTESAQQSAWGDMVAQLAAELAREKVAYAQRCSSSPTPI